MLQSTFTRMQGRSLILALLLGLATAIPALGQDSLSSEETLLSGITSSGGYGAPSWPSPQSTASSAR